MYVKYERTNLSNAVRISLRLIRRKEAVDAPRGIVVHGLVRAADAGSKQRPQMTVMAEDKHAAWRIAVEALLIELMLRSASSQGDPAYELVSLGVLAMDNIGDDEGEHVPHEKRDVVRIIRDLTRRAREPMA